MSRIYKEENKGWIDVVLVNVGFIEGQVTCFLEFPIDLLQTYHF